MNTLPSLNKDLMTPAHVLVISDDLEIARIWAFSLEQSGLNVSLSEMGEQAFQDVAERLPDLLVVDSHTWQGEDIEFCRKLRIDLVVPLLLFTSQNDEYYLLDAYKVGVDEVVAQPISPRLFMAKIRSWLRRTGSIPTSILDKVIVGSFKLDEELRQLLLPDGQVVRLTNLEARLLYVLMSHPNQPQKSKWLVERVWGYYGEGDSTLLKNLVYRLRHKIEPKPSSPRYLVTDGLLGYRFNCE